MTFCDPHNTFRPTDAFEYTDAYRDGLTLSPVALRQKLAALNERMKSLEKSITIPTYILAAYRGYEAALCFVERQVLPGVVKLDDTDPTPCQSLTPAGYV